MTKTKDFLPLLKLYHTIIYDSIALSMPGVLWLFCEESDEKDNLRISLMSSITKSLLIT